MRLKFRYLTLATIIIGVFHLFWSILFTPKRYFDAFKTLQYAFGTNDRNGTSGRIQHDHNLSYICTNNKTSNSNITEDIMCMKKPEFLENYKNPCWYDNHQKLRCLPYFHIFGVCKSGTTDLYNRMLTHPQIVQNEGLYGKETWFWSWKRYGIWNNHTTPGEAVLENCSVGVNVCSVVFSASDNHRHQSLSNFTDLFPLSNEMKYDTERQELYSTSVIGHGDPMDIWFPFDWREIPQNDPDSKEPVYITPHLIKHINPNIKLIVMIRDPTDRLFSHYIQHSRYGKEFSADDFHNKVKESVEIFDKCKQKNGTRACVYNLDVVEQMKVTLTAGIYSVLLKDWLDVFGKDQIFVIRTEDYSNNIAATLVSLFKFLNIDDVDLMTLTKMVCMKKAHKTDYSIINGKMKQHTWDILNTFYTTNQVDIQKYGIGMRIQPLNIPHSRMNCSGKEREVTTCKPCVNQCNYNNPFQNQNVIHYKVHKVNKRDFIPIKND